MRHFTRPRWRDGLHLVLSLSALAAIVGGLHVLGHVNPTTAAICMLVAVLVTAARARLAVAVVSSVVAMLALNYFFFPALYTFTIAEPQNWIALLAFLIVSVVASQLQVADRVRQRADLASTLLASLSHDLRTPLTTVSVAVANLQDPTLPAPQRQEQARIAAQELDRLTRLFADILDMARIDATALTLDRDWVTPADIIDAAIANLRPLLDDRLVEIDADAATSALVDPRLTSAALSHLVENAAQYSPASRPIHISGRVDAEGLRFTVRDYGPGLEPEEIDTLFERFQRGRHRGAHANGTGMGLAIARGLLIAEGGRVWGQNAEDGGAEFVVVLPAQRQPVPVVS